MSGDRLLEQAEIDSLLGSYDREVPSERALERMISSGLISFERLPMLEIVFDRMVRIMSTTLRNFTSDSVEATIDDVRSLRFGPFIETVPLPALFAVFKIEEWDNYGLVVIDSALIYSIVDVLLGGRRGTAAMRMEGRPYTTIERRLIERFVVLVLRDFAISFNPLCNVTIKFERLEVNPSFATISRTSNAAVVARFRIDMDDRGGRFDLLLPYATLEPARELLLQQFMGERFGRDSIWETHLAEQLHCTEVEMDVVLDETTMSLNDVMSLQVGSRILLNAAPGGAVQLRCGNVPLFGGRVGRKKDQVAVKIEETLHRLPTSSSHQGG